MFFRFECFIPLQIIDFHGALTNTGHIHVLVQDVACLKLIVSIQKLPIVAV